MGRVEESPPALISLGTSPPQPQPRKRNLTNAERKEICLEKDRNPKITQAQLAIWAQHEFGLPTAPTQATISNVLAKRAVYLEAGPEELSVRRKPRRPRSHPAIEDDLEMWVKRRREHGRRFPSTKRIKKKARHYAKKHHLDSKDVPEFSSSWVSAFLKKRSIKKHSTSKRDKRSRKHNTSDGERHTKRHRTQQPPLPTIPAHHHHHHQPDHQPSLNLLETYNLFFSNAAGHYA